MSRDFSRHFVPITLLLIFSCLTASLAVIAYQEVILNPIELSEADRIVSLLGVGQLPGMEWPGGWNTPAFSAISVFETAELNVGANLQHQETVLACVADPSFFDVLAVGAERGRLFNREDAQAGAEPVAVVSHEFWRSHFGNTQDLSEAKFFAAGRWVHVVGVLPAKIVFPAHAAVYLPHPDQPLFLGTSSGQVRSADDISQGEDRVIARLRPGFTVAQARAMVKATNEHLRKTNTDPHRGFGVVGARLLRDTVTIYVKGQLTTLIIAGVFVALVGLFSLFFLSAARTAELRKDMAVRIALGARPTALFRREVLWWLRVGVCASAAVLACTALAIRSARNMKALAIPRLGNLSISFSQAAWVVIGTMAVALLLEIPYLLACRKAEPITPILNRGESRSRLTLRPTVGKIVSIGQLSLALALTAIAVTIGVSYWRLAISPPGIDATRVFVSQPILTSSLNLGKQPPVSASNNLQNPVAQANPIGTANANSARSGNASNASGTSHEKSVNPNARPQAGNSAAASPSAVPSGSTGAMGAPGGLFESALTQERKSDRAATAKIEVQEDLDATSEVVHQPGVEGVALIDPAPFAASSGSGFAVDVAGKMVEGGAVTTYTVRGDVPEALGIRVLQGRWFEPDDYGTNAVAIGETFSKQYFGGHPLGKTLFIEQNSELRTIIGVVNDVTAYYGEKREPEMFIPMNPGSPLSGLGSIIAKMSPGTTRPPFPVRKVPGSLLEFQPWTSMTKMMSDAGATDRASAMVAGWFACLVLLLAAAGTYAVFWMITIQRQREMAIRICFGAFPSRVAIGMVLNAAMLAVCAGVGGFLIEYALERALSSRIYQFPVFSGTTFLISFSVIAVATLLSVARPAMSILRISPAELLRDN